MEPLYAALSFIAIAITVINIGRYVVGRTSAKRAQRQMMRDVEPLRHLDEQAVTDVTHAYGIRVSTDTPVYEVTGPVEATKISYGTVSGQLFYVGHIEIAAKSVSALADAGITLEKFLPGGDAAHETVETDSVRADRLRGDGVLVDRFAGGDASLRHIELCFPDGDDPARAACYVLAFDGRRIV